MHLISKKDEASEIVEKFGRTCSIMELAFQLTNSKFSSDAHVLVNAATSNYQQMKVFGIKG
jgi:hypothetical protein